MNTIEKNTVDIQELADEIIGGRRLSRGEDLSFFVTCDLNELKKGADRLREYFCGEKVDLCTVISAKSGKCGENCRFCAQSVHHHTACEEYGFMPEEEIVAQMLANEAEGVDCCGIVCSGHHPSSEEFEKIIHCIERMKKEGRIKLCASLGFLTEEQFARVREAGLTRVHNNIETSRAFFQKICTTHTFDDKIANIKRAQAQGLKVCSGGIIGLGESFEDRIDMALTLAELSIRSIPVNSLMPIKGTPMENNRRLTEEEILRTIGMFRFLNPEADIRLAGGRALMKNNGEETFVSGASASITGNMLTTSASTIKSDRAMLQRLGREVIPC